MTTTDSNDPIEKIAFDIKKALGTNDYYYAVRKTNNSLTSGLYLVKGNKIAYSNETARIFELCSSRFDADHIQNGVWIIQSNSDEIKHIRFYNPELFSGDLLMLVLFQEFAKTPETPEDQEKLEKAIKAEKIKKTLVYSCYTNSQDDILSRVKTASMPNLNQKLQYAGTPLGLCAEKNFLKGFIAIAEAGADLTKMSVVGTPLEIAFKSSPDIVWYIFENHRDIFDKIVKKIGFSIAKSITDRKLLQCIFDAGCDIKGKDLNFPTLHNFTDFNNLIGMQFVLDNGFDINFKNKKKQTALDRAKIKGHDKAMEFLIARGAQ